MNTFGDRLRDARAARGLTQDELAELLEVSKSAVSAWENNKEQPTFEKLPRLRQHLQISLDALIVGAGLAAWQQTKSALPGVPSPAYGSDSSDGLARDEIKLLRLYRGLNDRKRKAVIIMMNAEKK